MLLHSAEGKEIIFNRQDIKHGDIEVHEKTVSGATPSAPPPPPPSGYKTLVKLYVRKTGHEVGVFSGSNCEIRGWCNLDSSQQRVGIDLPQDTSFSAQNGGLGLLVAERELVTNGKPANISMGLYEEGGTGVDNRQFVYFIVDFTRLTNEIRTFYDGQVRTRVTTYAGFEGTVWWQLQGV